MMNCIAPLAKISIFFLLVSTTCLSGCGSVGKEIVVPMNPDVGFLRNQRLPAKVGLLLSEKSRFYEFRGTSSDSEFPNLVHVFPLGKALETASFQVFSQCFNGVTKIQSPSGAADFRNVMEPEIEDFRFHYKVIHVGGGTSAIDYMVMAASMKVHVTFYGEGKKIWETSVKCPEQEVKIPYFNYSPLEQEGIGQAASQALVCSLKTIAQQLSNSVEVYDYLTGTR